MSECIVVWIQVTNSDMNQLDIHLLVCVHTGQALINHRGSVGAGGVGPRRDPGCLTKQSEAERSEWVEGL